MVAGLVSPLADQVTRALNRPLHRGIVKFEQCEPQYALARQILTKSTMLVSILDDINDVHGTIEELEQFTKMIERWDTSMEDLPDYTKVWFEALFVSSSEIEEETTKEGRSYCVSYTKEAINLILLLTQSARCFNEDHVPTLEENRKNGVFSCTYPLLTVSSLCGMGKIASKEAHRRCGIS
ncbi:hypothetical protein POTOM_039975 [Populus tomentosa]|uniref:Terpene synthase metal-binding domain-containing protein n=1 Tax=Populus tomentosa TaxID=118781 RepID=A0A8X8CJJ8_POPTO|nr:hypothetical protein POTOM_039975 [Populus tomentosa]